ncbi:MAG: response regulator transcription factor [Actinomycetes bacterium]
MLNRSIRMLVADDAQAIHGIFREVAARSCGLIELLEVADGRECVKLLSGGDIDLAFIDVYMPEMSGLEALRSARHVGIKTFVTLMSGPDSDHFMNFAQQLSSTLHISGRVTERFGESLQQGGGNFHSFRVLPGRR